MKNNQKVFKPTRNVDTWIDLIRKGGGTIFIDPAPMPKPLEAWVTMFGKIFRKKI